MFRSLWSQRKGSNIHCEFWNRRWNAVMVMQRLDLSSSTKTVPIQSAYLNIDVPAIKCFLNIKTISTDKYILMSSRAIRKNYLSIKLVLSLRKEWVVESVLVPCFVTGLELKHQDLEITVVSIPFYIMHIFNI